MPQKMGEPEIPPLPKIRKLTEGLKERVGAKRRGKRRKSDSKREGDDDALISQPSHPER
ncbi:MAG: hypothetical protein ACO2PL_19125 [Armatimonadota bacterium]